MVMLLFRHILLLALLGFASIGNGQLFSSKCPHIIRGDYSFSTGEMQGAIFHYTNSIADNPRNGEAYLKRGRTHVALGKITQAIKDYEMAALIDPVFIKTHYNLEESENKTPSQKRQFQNLNPSKI
ncbi:MAG: tetratricopeptide (TPR) repeat protein [Cyclobacteriaceae bacterium]|jgi:tetratricopeptide (TPR) repeat protein